MDERMRRIDALTDHVIECLGERETLAAILRAMDYDSQAEIMEYIARMYDLEDENDDQ